MDQCQCNNKRLDKQIVIKKVENGFIVEQDTGEVSLFLNPLRKQFIAKNPLELTSIINQLVSENGSKNE